MGKILRLQSSTLDFLENNVKKLDHLWEAKNKSSCNQFNLLATDKWYFENKPKVSV